MPRTSYLLSIDGPNDVDLDSLRAAIRIYFAGDRDI